MDAGNFPGGSFPYTCARELPDSWVCLRVFQERSQSFDSPGSPALNNDSPSLGEETQNKEVK